MEVNYSKKQINPIISKFAINPETNSMFKRIITMFDGQTNYQIWAIKAVFGKKASIEDIEHIKEWADNNQTHIKMLSKQNIVSYGSSTTEFANLFHEIHGVDMISAVKSTIEKFNTAQRKMLNDDIFKNNQPSNGMEAYTNKNFTTWYEILRKFETIASSRKSLFITKASAYTNIAALRKGIEDALLASYDWNKEDLLSYVERNTPNTKVVYNNGDIVILQVKSFADSHKLCGGGRTGWCITREESYFKQYILDKKNHRQYFYFDFSKKDNDELAHIGFTVNNDNGIVNAHSTRNSNMLGEGIMYKGKRINVQTVLRENNVKPSVYLELKKLVNYTWDLENILAFLNSHKEEFALSITEDNRLVVCCLNRQALKSLTQHTLVNPNNIAFNNESKVYVLIDCNLPYDDENSTLVMSFIKDRFKTFSLSNILNTYNGNITKENYLSKIHMTTDKFLAKEKISPTLLLHKYIIEHNEEAACKLIAECGDEIDINFEFENQTPIFLAIQNNFFNLFSMIINNPKFNQNITDIFGENIFTSLIYEYAGKLEAEPNDKNGIEAFEKMITILIESDNFNKNAQNINLDTALYVACERKETNWIVERLLAQPNVDIHIINDYNCDALGYALKFNNIDAVKLLSQREDFTVIDSSLEIAKTCGISLESIIPSFVKA